MVGCRKRARPKRLDNTPVCTCARVLSCCVDSETPARLNLHVSPELYLRIQRSAAHETLREHRRVTISAWVRQAIEDRLAREEAEK